MSHITFGRMSVAELSKVDGADKAGLSGCNQTQMWSGPRHGGPTTSAASGGDEGGVGGAQLDDLWPIEGIHEPRQTAAMDEAGDLLSSPVLTCFTTHPQKLWI